MTIEHFGAAVRRTAAGITLAAVFLMAGLTALIPAQTKAAMSGVPAIVKTVAGDEIAFQQSAGRCTLAAVTHMIRGRLYLMGNDAWQEVTEETVGRTAWGGAGMNWKWTYQNGDITVNVDKEDMSGMTLDDVRSWLREHPEGFTLYCVGDRGQHAVYVTDIEDGKVMCFDPAQTYCGCRRTLDTSNLAYFFGDQEDILAQAYRIWYITDDNLGQTREIVSVLPVTHEIV